MNAKKAAKAGNPPTTYGEFSTRREALNRVITSGLWCHRVWETMFIYEAGSREWSLDELNKVGDLYRGFFGPVRFALVSAALLQFAKALDRDSRTVSLPSLLAAARLNPSVVPHATPADLDDIDKDLDLIKKQKKLLIRHRNKVLAHADANPSPTDAILKVDFDVLIERVKSAFNRLSYAHDKTSSHWQLSMDEVNYHATEVLKLVVSEVA